MAMSNTEIVRAIEEQNIESYGVKAEYFDEGVVVYEPPSLPYGGTYRGLAGMGELVRNQEATWSKQAFKVLEYAASNDKVVTLVQLQCVSRATGETVDTYITEWWTLRAGKVTEIRIFYADPASVAAVTGGPGFRGAL